MNGRQLSTKRVILMLGAPVVLALTASLVLFDVNTPEWLGLGLALAWPATALAGCVAIVTAQVIPTLIKGLLAPLYLAVFGWGLLVSLVATGVVLV